MANLCSNHMHIEGDKEDIAPLARAIRDQDKELLSIFCWFEFTDADYGLWENTFTPEQESINLSFGSKYRFPQYFDSLAEKYSRLTFEIYSEEPGMLIYEKITASNGTVHREDLGPMDYYTKMNEDFAHERKYLKEADYKEFLSYVLDDWDADEIEFVYHFLEKEIIERIETKDLPLFIGKEWLFNDNAISLIENRLKGV